MKGDFWSFVDKTGDCWLWQRAVSSRGYGVVVVDGKQTTAHRHAWALTFGPIPAGLVACHRCDNPRCVRPDHIFIGTQSDNIQDMLAKGRQYQGPRPWMSRPRGCAKGEKVGGARLTADAVREIRAKYVRGVVGQKRLAAEYGVSRSAIEGVVRRKTWRHV